MDETRERLAAWMTRLAIWFFWGAVMVLAPLIAVISALAFGVTIGVYYAKRECARSDQKEREQLESDVKGVLDDLGKQEPGGPNPIDPMALFN